MSMTTDDMRWYVIKVYSNLIQQLPDYRIVELYRNVKANPPRAKVIQEKFKPDFGVQLKIGINGIEEDW